MAMDMDNGKNNGGVTTPVHPAVYACFSWNNITTFTGWYLPAVNELNMIFYNLSTSSNPWSMDPVAYYWSSTQMDMNNAWKQNGSFHEKTGLYRVRCMRSIPLVAPTSAQCGSAARTYGS